MLAHRNTQGHDQAHQQEYGASKELADSGLVASCLDEDAAEGAVEDAVGNAAENAVGNAAEDTAEDAVLGGHDRLCLHQKWGGIQRSDSSQVEAGVDLEVTSKFLVAGLRFPDILSCW